MHQNQTDGTQDTYDNFSLFYRELIAATGHLAAEERMLDQLIQALGISAKSSILDAACGTGDALGHLRRRGFTNICGMDASRGMLRRAKQLNPRIRLVRRRWEEVDLQSFDVSKHFRLVYLLSLSLPHAEGAKLPTILTRFFSLLQVGGHLVFDVRNWRRSSTGCLRERERPRGCARVLGNIDAVNRKWQVTDRCSYTSDRQIVDYEIAAADPHQDRLHFSVSYALLTADDFVRMLKDAGFCHIDCFRFDGWPYTVLRAEVGRRA
ncbi:MAG TPA: class I SAM-dependent methyltransferase [Verrucomicrobiae bacterium]|nr:class I SAM-dependent methyltransferase [Verrucomicrobiae bacterium]